MIMTRMHALESLLVSLLITLMVSTAHGAQAQPASAAADH
jgi:hypothetical protein